MTILYLSMMFCKNISQLFSVIFTWKDTDIFIFLLKFFHELVIARDLCLPYRYMVDIMRGVYECGL